jgi:predicted DNA-binding protein YlxM (UPF0122 family)
MVISKIVWYIDESKWFQKRSLFKDRLSIIKERHLQLTDERKKKVIDLYFNQHKTYAEIAQIERISPRDIHAIIKEEEARRQKYKHQQLQAELSSKAYKLFSEGKTPVQVAVTLNLGQPEVTKLYREYWRLKRMHILNSIFKETNGKIWTFLKLYKELIKKRRMSIEQVVNAVEIAIHKLPYMESLYIQAKDQAEKMQRTIQQLANYIGALEYKISILDKIAFASEQHCKRTEQQLQELGDKKDRLEKLIANILNGEGYSKLKAIAKENVKDVLSEEKKVISVCFTALIQTLKTDPKIVDLIYNMPTDNDGKQHEDNNIVKYLESNKDRIMDLSKKNYENLIEVLTNNVISTAAGAASSSSNPPPSLPSSSALLGPYNKSDTYITEKEEMFHDSKGDIAD